MAGSVGSWVGARGPRAAAWAAVGAMCAAFGPYEPLIDLEVDYLRNGGEVSVGKYHVWYSVYDGGVGIPNHWVVEQLRPISERIVAHIQARQPGIEPCRPEDHLQIYTVPAEVLNDRDRFYDYRHPGPIWGLYDVRLDEQRMSAIILSPRPSAQRELLTHELAHYWHHRFCLAGKSAFPESEAFALQMERR